MRARDAAAQIGVSEGELLASRIGDDKDEGANVVRLSDDAQSILCQLLPLGRLMALTRNEHCVHERKGIYEKPKFFPHGGSHIGLFANPDIDLRLFMSHWKFAFAVREDARGKPRTSLQFFDQDGQAIHKIYSTQECDQAAFDALIDAHLHSDQQAGITTQSYPPPPADQPDQDIDWKGLRTSWEKLKDTHDFYPMLQKFKVGRVQALRGIGEDFAYPVGNEAARTILQMARDRQCEIMVFVGNKGCLQIHTGGVKKLVEHGPWYNVLDEAFNLHLRESAVRQSWVTKKPTDDGIVTALEVFSDQGELSATFFGKRKPGIQELPLWRDIVNDIPVKNSSHVA